MQNTGECPTKGSTENWNFQCILLIVLETGLFLGSFIHPLSPGHFVKEVNKQIELQGL